MKISTVGIDKTPEGNTLRVKRHCLGMVNVSDFFSLIFPFGISQSFCDKKVKYI